MKLIRIFTSVIFIILLTSCSTEKNVASSTLFSQEEGKYVLLFIFDEEAPQETVNEVSGKVIDKAIDEDMLEEATITQSPEKYNLELESLPAILIIGTKGIKKEAYSAEEAIEYLESQSQEKSAMIRWYIQASEIFEL